MENELVTDRLGNPLKVGDRCFAELQIIEINSPSANFTNLVCRVVNKPEDTYHPEIFITNQVVEKAPNTQRRLHFIAPGDLRVGSTFTTIRRGHKWLQATGVIEICEDQPRGSHHMLGKAEIISTTLTTFDKLRREDILKYPSIAVRRLSGYGHEHEQKAALREELRVAYPGFTDSETCTVILLKRIE